MDAVLFLLCQSLFQCLCQLVGAGGSLRTTGDALQTGDGFGGVHAFDQSTDALEVAVAAADVLNVFDLAIFDLEQDLTGASAAGLV